MRRLDMPKINFKSHYEKCVDGKQEPVRSNLLGCISFLVGKNKKYRAYAKNSSLYRLQKTDPSHIAPAKKNQLKQLYEERMAREGAPGKKIYDRIMTAARACPYCGHGTLFTLDHYLPKGISHFPELSIAPLNLIPACRDCNSNKHVHVPTREEEQYIHPYFEDVDGHNWLAASTHYSTVDELTVTYAVSDTLTDPVLKSRIKKQFKDLKLNYIYSAQAATELVPTYTLLKQRHEDGGVPNVVEYLREQERFRSELSKNDWRAVFYRALLADSRVHAMRWKL